jgi:hypothetical protein
MSAHKAVTVLPGRPDAVFEYLADVDKLSAYLPMVTSATRTGREDAVLRIRVGGVPSSLGVWVRAYSDRRRLAWGTVDNSYRGEVHVGPPRPGDDTDVSVVTITLESDHHADEAFRRALDDVTEALSSALGNGRTGS